MVSPVSASAGNVVHDVVGQPVVGLRGICRGIHTPVVAEGLGIRRLCPGVSVSLEVTE